MSSDPVLGGSLWTDTAVFSILSLEQGATVTFLLRSPSAFDNDTTIQEHVKSGKARLVKGDALNAEDAKAAWAEASRDKPVDLLLFTLGFGASISPLPTLSYSISDHLLHRHSRNAFIPHSQRLRHSPSRPCNEVSPQLPLHDAKRESLPQSHRRHHRRLDQNPPKEQHPFPPHTHVQLPPRTRSQG